jgi:ribosomal protein L9
MATTQQFLLREDIDTLGRTRRNRQSKSRLRAKLSFPQRFGDFGDQRKFKQIEQERAALLKKAAHEKSTAEAQAEQMSDIALEFRAQSRRAGTSFRFGDFDGYCRRFKGERLRN